jgi:hypothetical protein
MCCISCETFHYAVSSFLQLLVRHREELLHSEADLASAHCVLQRSVRSISEEILLVVGMADDMLAALPLEALLRIADEDLVREMKANK